MYKVTKSLTFCYGHRLLNYAGKCRYLHGHNGTVEIDLSAERLDGRGMVWDFTEIKRTLQGWIDTNLDHKMILCRRDPALAQMRKLKEPVFVIEENPTAEHLAKLIYEQAKRMGFPVTAVRLWETDRSVACYEPSRAPARHRSAKRSRTISTAA